MKGFNKLKVRQMMQIQFHSKNIFVRGLLFMLS
ncbi:hypothetical protein NC651_023562 [Populus alba x Populus x berolinensis]|nr:hypothetical protein NC651_023562 [Populus alba x Populus x berolinensis]